eukprot:TRINITY_DN66953_c5_g1_i1.p2 TRINITY_DN66953_c5_g1~~TRINITY_DN66953_c5_g1_i1.p2  ORF type:complete len:245 (-),score=17.97 TRINITY_DN66953_c5_g1_i1:1150-1884(-)
MVPLPPVVIVFSVVVLPFGTAWVLYQCFPTPTTWLWSKLSTLWHHATNPHCLLAATYSTLSTLFISFITCSTLLPSTTTVNYRTTTTTSSSSSASNATTPSSLMVIIIIIIMMPNYTTLCGNVSLCLFGAANVRRCQQIRLITTLLLFIVVVVFVGVGSEHMFSASKYMILVESVSPPFDLAIITYSNVGQLLANTQVTFNNSNIKLYLLEKSSLRSLNEMQEDFALEHLLIHNPPPRLFAMDN